LLEILLGTSISYMSRVVEIKPNLNQEVTMPEMLTLREAAERTGLTVGCLQKWVARKEIRYIKLGRKAIRLRESDLAKLIAQGTVEPILSRKSA
jgi:excisionase family DNA binding protein